MLGNGCAERYLGRQLTINGYHETELANRIATGWRAFFKFKDALCNCSLALKVRLKLFESVVTPCVLYACGTWTMTIEAERLLTTARRKMLRRLVKVGRMPEEDWVAYIQRATRRSEELAAAHGALNWVGLQRRTKWKLAGETARRGDGRWSTRILSWQPWFRVSPRRCVGRPRRRWDDDITQLAGESLKDEAQDVGLWTALQPGYVEKLR